MRRRRNRVRVELSIDGDQPVIHFSSRASTADREMVREWITLNHRKRRELGFALNGFGDIEADRDRWKRAAIKMAPAAGPAWTPRFVWDELPDDEDTA